MLLIFQPAKETDGGARLICETGLLERYHVLRIFGLHLWPDLPAGELFTRSGSLMAKSSEVNVEVTGKSAHISRAKEGADALWAGAIVSASIVPVAPATARRCVALPSAMNNVFFGLTGGFRSGTANTQGVTFGNLYLRSD